MPVYDKKLNVLSHRHICVCTIHDEPGVYNIERTSLLMYMPRGDNGECKNRSANDITKHRVYMIKLVSPSSPPISPYPSRRL